eukprot:m.97550 g.97550  ORF g.97550 m.97550 type:complete len:331 (+) comp20539_c0_seq1:520-1512(+)
MLLERRDDVAVFEQDSNKDHDPLVLAVKPVGFRHDRLSRESVQRHLGLDKRLKDLEPLRHGLLEVVGHCERRDARAEILGTLAGGFLRSVHRPFQVIIVLHVIVGSSGCGGNDGGVGVRAFIIITAVAVSITFHRLATLGSASLLLRATLLSARPARTIGWVVDDKGRELVRKREEAAVTACLARRLDLLLLGDPKHSLRVRALFAEHKLFDETVKDLLESVGFKRPVDNVPVFGCVHLGLGTQLDTEVLRRIRRRAIERLGNVRHVGDGRFDSIPTALHFTDDHWHLVPIERVLHLAVHVDHARHDCLLGLLREEFSEPPLTEQGRYNA